MKSYSGFININDTDTFSGGYKFSKDVVEKMIEDLGGKPVTLNFSHVGVGTVHDSGRFKNGILVTFALDDVLIMKDPLYMVSSVEVAKMHKISEGVHVIDEAKIIDVSLVQMPADTMLTPIQEKKEEPE